jgi:Fic family protein
MAPRCFRRVAVKPGQLRQREVIVARNVGPSWEQLPAFLDRFAAEYASARHHGVMPVIAIAASHHRLMWIHLFLDGNGRVTWLYTDACFLRLPLPGSSLWNVSRGLARRRDAYMTAFSGADAHRCNDSDGRGNLSDKGLAAFCGFFWIFAWIRSHLCGTCSCSMGSLTVSRAMLPCVGQKLFQGQGRNFIS